MLPAKPLLLHRFRCIKLVFLCITSGEFARTGRSSTNSLASCKNFGSLLHKHLGCAVVHARAQGVLGGPSCSVSAYPPLITPPSCLHTCTALLRSHPRPLKNLFGRRHDVLFFGQWVAKHKTVRPSLFCFPTFLRCPRERACFARLDAEDRSSCSTFATWRMVAALGSSFSPGTCATFAALSLQIW